MESGYGEVRFHANDIERKFVVIKDVEEEIFVIFEKLKLDAPRLLLIVSQEDVSLNDGLEIKKGLSDIAKRADAWLLTRCDDTVQSMKLGSRPYRTSLMTPMHEVTIGIVGLHKLCHKEKFERARGTVIDYRQKGGQNYRHLDPYNTHYIMMDNDITDIGDVERKLRETLSNNHKGKIPLVSLRFNFLGENAQENAQDIYNVCIHLSLSNDSRNEEVRKILRQGITTYYIPTINTENLDQVIMDSVLTNTDEPLRWMEFSIALSSQQFAEKIINSRKLLEKKQDLKKIAGILLEEDRVKLMELMLDRGMNVERIFTFDMIYNTQSLLPGGKYQDINDLLKWKEGDDRVKRIKELMKRLLGNFCSPKIDKTNMFKHLFLWSVFQNRQEMAMLFWGHCKDKIAAALVANGLFNGLANEEKTREMRETLQNNAGEFRKMAEKLLQACHKNNEEDTQILLSGKNDWDDSSCLHLAAKTGNKSFISQDACQCLFDDVWDRNVPLLHSPKNEVDTNGCTKVSFGPKCKYILHAISHILFLLTYSFYLLIAMSVDIHFLDVLLMFWVLTIFLEEIRQAIMYPLKPLRRKLQCYITDNWNILDIISIAFFVLGMCLRFLPYNGCLEAARVVLAVDLLVFYIRVFELFSAYRKIGPKITMIRELMMDLWYFIFILLVILVGYALAAYSIIYPNSIFNFDLMSNVFKTAYWNLHGELFLSDLEHKEPECTKDPVLYNNGTLPRCPTEVGADLGPVMMGIYVLFSNILLLNLLIAMFSYSFEKVQENATLIWNTQRYFLIREYSMRPVLPPPLIIISLCWLGLQKVGKICKKRCNRTCYPGSYEMRRIAADAGVANTDDLFQPQRTLENAIAFRMFERAKIQRDEELSKPDNIMQVVTENENYSWTEQSETVEADSGKPENPELVYRYAIPSGADVANFQPQPTLKIRARIQPDEELSKPDNVMQIPVVSAAMPSETFEADNGELGNFESMYEQLSTEDYLYAPISYDTDSDDN